MATSTYGFPKNDLTAAIAAADELAGRYRDGTMRRLHPDGSIEVAAMEGWFRRRFLLYRVGSDGTPVLVESAGAPPEYSLFVAMILGGAALFAGSILTAIVLGDAAHHVVGLGIVGFIACFIGAVCSNRFGLSWYLRETFGSDSEWQQPYAPTEWAPRSVDQLRAVELLADWHGGKAFARPHPDGGTEVRTLKRGRLHTHVVGSDGTSLLVDRSKPAALHTLGAAGMAIGGGGAIVATLLYNLTDLDVDAAFHASIGLLFAGVVLRSIVTLESRVKNRAAEGWHLVQTKADDPIDMD